eukprot:4056359-Prorocentrum_lima.AAC.1
MTSSLVGSEMCIRDRAHIFGELALDDPELGAAALPVRSKLFITSFLDKRCLLYTSDAADDM